MIHTVYTPAGVHITFCLFYFSFEQVATLGCLQNLSSAFDLLSAECKTMPPAKAKRCKVELQEALPLYVLYYKVPHFTHATLGSLEGKDLKRLRLCNKQMKQMVEDFCQRRGKAWTRLALNCPTTVTHIDDLRLRLSDCQFIPTNDSDLCWCWEPNAKPRDENILLEGFVICHSKGCAKLIQVKKELLDSAQNKTWSYKSVSAVSAPGDDKVALEITYTNLVGKYSKVAVLVYNLDGTFFAGKSIASPEDSMLQNVFQEQFLQSAAIFLERSRKLAVVSLTQREEGSHQLATKVHATHWILAGNLRHFPAGSGDTFIVDDTIGHFHAVHVQPDLMLESEEIFEEERNRHLMAINRELILTLNMEKRDELHLSWSRLNHSPVVLTHKKIKEWLPFKAELVQQDEITAVILGKEGLKAMLRTVVFILHNNQIVKTLTYKDCAQMASLKKYLQPVFLWQNVILLFLVDNESMMVDLKNEKCLKMERTSPFMSAHREGIKVWHWRGKGDSTVKFWSVR